MLTRSGTGSCRSSTEFRPKSLPAILTRSRKRKSTVLQEDNSEMSIQHDRAGCSVFPSKDLRRMSRRRSRPMSPQSDRERNLELFRHPDDCGSSRLGPPSKCSDEDSILSSLSIEDSLSGRSTPPTHCKVKRTTGSEDSRSLECYRPSPLPPVSFGDCSEIWDLMCKMDAKYQKSVDVFKNHPVLSPQMRAILLDWIMDVCEAYNLHRETLYLAMDYLDRYLALQHNVLKHHLQLIGITCLFVASKVEEIYPPKLQTFSYVTDGACSDSEILDMELVVMKTLKWKLTPITPATWVNVYLQVLSISPYSTRSHDFLRAVRLHRDLKPEDARLVRPQYSGVDFVRAMRVVDLTTLDLNALRFSYSTIAAAAIYHTKGRQAALGSSGFTWEQLGPCVLWMAPFASVVKKEDVPDVLPGISGVSDEARHLIQAHCISLSMLDQVQLLASTSKICSPMSHTDGLLTPPRSSEKYRRVKH